MEILLILLVVIIILGAILGGESFGGTIRKGCGFLILLVIIIVAVGVIFYSGLESKEVPNGKEEVSQSNDSA